MGIYKEKGLADECRVEAEQIDASREARRRAEMLQAARRERWKYRREAFEGWLAHDGNGTAMVVLIVIIAVGIIVGHAIGLNDKLKAAKKWRVQAACFSGCTAQGPSSCGKTVKVIAEKEACFCQRETCGTWAVPVER